MNINKYGFVRVGAATPKLKVADCEYNVSQIKNVINTAVNKKFNYFVFLNFL